MKKVGVIIGSVNDKPVIMEAVKVFEEFEVPYELIVASAHRNPEKVRKFCKRAEKEMSLIIAGAGAAAHLPGVIASQVTLPVIGVPIFSKPLKGIDAFLSIVQMPSGVPVATVAINGAKNAALLAIQILAVSEKKLKEKFKKFKEALAKK